MRILVLGGTRFLTRELARLAVLAGHDVICAARGQSGPVPDGARLVEIERSSSDGLAPLSGQRFDAVVDPATRPSWVRAALAALGDAAAHWTYVSSCSVYRDEQTPGQTADAPIRDPAPDGASEIDMEIYGELKVSSESAVRAAVGDRALICRPGLIIGPGDPSGRFTYWAERLAEGGEVLAPGSPDDDVQMIDVRDLAAWLLASIEARRVGTFDATSPPVSRREFLLSVGGPQVEQRLTWVDQDFLVRESVAPWMGPRSLPLWLPLSEYSGFLNRDVTASVQAGMTFRPLADTARDTVAWVRGAADVARTGLTRDEEARLLDEWHRR